MTEGFTTRNVNSKLRMIYSDRFSSASMYAYMCQCILSFKKFHLHNHWSSSNLVSWNIITKTCLYNSDPFKPHFYIVKLGFTGVSIIFLISAQKHRLWILVRTASRRRFYWVPTIYVLSRNMKNIRIFFIWKFSFFGGKIFIIFE